MKLLIGGSPCTYWSIAQTKNRETEASGLGWELFKNYVTAREKYKPDYFLYENNKSMSAAIRAQITKELGVEPVLINSALVSAQSRQRLYWVGKRNQDGTYSQVEVEQPEDRGILLRDILESGVCWTEKAYTLRAQYYKNSAANVASGHYVAPMAAEPVNVTADGKAQCLRATYYKDGIRNMVGNEIDRKTCVAEPVRVCNINGGGQGNRIYSTDAKSCAIKSSGGGVGAKTGLYAVPTIEPCNYEIIDGAKVLIANGKIRQGDEKGSKQGKYVYTELCEKANSITAGQAHNEKFLHCVREGAEPVLCEFCEYCEKLDKHVYRVRDGFITIKGKRYPIKLRDGCYIIRKLTVTECKRLQTVPDNYEFPVSDTQAYKMLGNGWTVDVIAHIMSHFGGLTEEAVEVLSMYDGMSCGHIALDKLGANITRYYATEIDKYAVQTTQHNYPETVQMGDAFDVREPEWKIGMV